MAKAQIKILPAKIQTDLVIQISQIPKVIIFKKSSQLKSLIQQLPEEIIVEILSLMEQIGKVVHAEKYILVKTNYYELKQLISQLGSEKVEEAKTEEVEVEYVKEKSGLEFIITPEVFELSEFETRVSSEATGKLAKELEKAVEEFETPEELENEKEIVKEEAREKIYVGFEYVYLE